LKKRRVDHHSEKTAEAPMATSMGTYVQNPDGSEHYDGRLCPDVQIALKAPHVPWSSAMMGKAAVQSMAVQAAQAAGLQVARSATCQHTGPDPSTKNQRDIHVCFLPEGLTEEIIKDMFNQAMLAGGMVQGPDNAVHAVMLSSKTSQKCFLEMSTEQHATNVLQLNGLDMGGRKLAISRCKGYIPPVTSMAMRIATTQASTAGIATNSMAQAAPIQPWITGGATTRIIEIANIASVKELLDDEAYSELIEDTKLECAKFGEVLSIFACRPKRADGDHHNKDVGLIFVEFGSIEVAAASATVLQGRTFDGNAVGVRFISEGDYATKAKEGREGEMWRSTERDVQEPAAGAGAAPLTAPHRI
jgi:hypothetical protein